MKIINYFNFFFILIFINLSLSETKKKSIKTKLKQKYFKVKEKNKEKNKKSKSRRLQKDAEYKPIRLLIDRTYIETLVQGSGDFPKEGYYSSFDRCISIITKLVNVKPITKPIKLNFSEFKELNDTIVNGTLKDKGNLNYDLIIVGIIKFNASKEMTSVSVLRDEDSKRTTLGIINIKFKSDMPKNYFHYFDYQLLHHIIHLLGFSYESFKYFPEGINKTIKTEKDIYGLERDYIITPKVVSFARKYFRCPTLDKVPLENQNLNFDKAQLENHNQDEEKKVAHWESRILLGEIMSSYKYYSEQIISEFTLELLEDSKWYTINKFTGGLMRYGKYKGCEFLDEDCSPKFKNEFYPKSDMEYNPGCSSGRQSRAYFIQKNKYIEKKEYNRYGNRGGPEIVEYCIIPDHYDVETNQNYFSGNCQFGDNEYRNGINFAYGINFADREMLSNLFNESFSNHSFCVLASIDRKNDTEQNYQKYVIPYCYEMFCSKRRLTIKIGRQYLVCPISGGKVEIKGDFEGYIYCPDFNLICTGTVMCNDVFDCISSNSTSNENSFNYSYEIKTNQINEELLNETVLDDGYEEDEENGKCPNDCNQCYEGGKCFNCKKDFYIIGTKIGESNNKCQDIDISIGYFKYEYVYYPCLNNCAKCDNETICNECKVNYYFIGNNRTFCDSGKNLNKYYTTDGGISYFPCDTHFPKCDECENRDNYCYKCVENYHFINTKDVCTNQSIINYFSENGEGIIYYLCSDYIQNCSTCISGNECTRCITPYYFLKNDRTKCYTGDNLDEFFSNDTGISYYPCDTNFPNCLKCSDGNTCTQCKENFVFLRGEKKVCYPYEKDKLFEEDHKFYLCNESISNCENCRSRYACYKCEEGYVLIRNATNQLNCLQADITKYYKLPDESYRLCSDAIPNCEKCDNGTFCTNCYNEFYFYKKERNRCRNDLDLREYFSEDNGISYYPCIEEIDKCIYCSSKEICDECIENYYLYKENRKDCIQLDDIEKYYRNGSSYYPCNESIKDCNKCFDSQSCYECYDGKKIIYQEQNKCYEDSYFDDNKSYYKKNETFYGKCSDALPNCSTCYNDSICISCEANYYFINDNYTECIYIDSIKPENEYYKGDELNYYTCSFKGVKNCKKCIDENTCFLCDKDYALFFYNYSFCHPKSDFNKGYYHDFSEIMYYPCFNNCEICTNGTECVKCLDNFFSFSENRICEVCTVNFKYINEEFTDELLKNYTNDYINENKNKYSFVDVYINEKANFIILIFRAWYCTNSLLENNYFEINVEELTSRLSYNLSTSKHFVISYVNYKYKNYLEVYDIDKNKLINITEYCPECLEENFLKITHNFTKEMNLLGEVIQNKIFENDINIYDKDDPIFNDICLNFTLENVDLTIKERREIMFLGNKKIEMLCYDTNCELESFSMNNFISFCNCKIQTDIKNLFLDSDTNNANDMANEEYDNYINSKSSINSFTIFKCAKEAFSPEKIKNNANLYIFLILIVIQLILFGFYLLFPKLKKMMKKKEKNKESGKPNPPKVENFSITDDFEDDDIYPNIKSEKGDLEKDIQEKDKQILYNDVSDDDIGDPEKVIQDKDIDSVREREIENEIINSGGEITEETLTAKINLFREKRIRTKFGKDIINSETSQEMTSSKKNKYKFQFEGSYSGDEGVPDINGKKIYKKYKEFGTERNSVSSKESFSPSEIDNIQNEIIQKTEYVNFTEAKKNPTVSFLEYYWKLVQLKQPIINLLSPIKCLKLEESHIPTLVKFMRIIFVLSLNMFFNILHLEQKYFRKKYNYFNEKYNIRYVYLDQKISLSERFTYGLGHAVLSGFISFLICLVIQSVLNYFFFNIRKKLDKAIEGKEIDDNEKKYKKNKSKKNENKEEILEILRKAKKTYIIIFAVVFAFMIIVFYSAINFAGVYIGGVLDFIAGVFWTFIFLQIIPFIYCLIFSLCRYLGIKKDIEILYNIGQSIFF